MSQPGEFSYRRVHRASPQLLFDVMTQPEHLTHFWGPDGTTTPVDGITVDLRQQKETAQIDIIDNGIGIPPGELPHIFDRFYRVDKSRSSAGFGLGLSIAQSIAKAHGGSITARPNQPQGTIFTISLPINTG